MKIHGKRPEPPPTPPPAERTGRGTHGVKVSVGQLRKDIALGKPKAFIKDLFDAHYIEKRSKALWNRVKPESAPVLTTKQERQRAELQRRFDQIGDEHL